MKKLPIIIFALAIALTITLFLIVKQNPQQQSYTHATITSESQFLEEMIPHHQEAVDTSKIILQTEKPELKSLAQKIIEAQEKEIEQMKNWNEEWFSSDKINENYFPMMPDLEKSSNKDCDYIDGMIFHHEMALHMAQQLLEINPRPELKQMANNILETQSIEISEMRNLKEKYC